VTSRPAPENALLGPSNAFSGADAFSGACGDPSNAFTGAGGDVTCPYKYFSKYPKTCFISRKIANHIQKNSKIDPTIVEGH